jgi:predicted ester cyclase
MTREEIVDLFERRNAAFADHDADGIAELCAETCVVESPLGGTHQGRAAVAQVFTAFFEAFDDATLALDDLIIDGENVVQVGTLSLTDTGGLMGMEPSGKPAQLPIVVVCRVADGLIVHERRIYDFTGLLVQIGVLKARPA